MIITGKDFDEVFKKGAIVLHNLPEIEVRGSITKELINATIEITNPLNVVLSNPHRKLSLDYLESEMEWYASGSLDSSWIGTKASMWNSIANPDGTVNSNYGYFAFHQQIPSENCKNQFEWVTESLIKDENSRQAIINFNQPYHKYDTNKDFVCTETMQFFIREKKLIGIVNMRSCDLVYGAGYDIPFFSYLMVKVLEELKETYPYLELGTLYHNSGSLHVYSRHFKMVSDIINDPQIYESTSVSPYVK